MTFSLADIEDAIRAVQLEPRGALRCTEDDQIPVSVAGAPARSMVLIGTSGSGFWPAFNTARATLGQEPQPLDTYSRQVITTLAREFNAQAWFPFGGPPWLPFQRWAQRAEAVHTSPIGPLIHPQYGLWHAYRGALSFTRVLPGITDPPAEPHPCDSCHDKPCLSTCPVAAFSVQGYAVPVCIGHLQGPAGRPCMETGCLARQACPVGVGYHYQPEHAQFHMRAFRAAHAQ